MIVFVAGCTDKSNDLQNQGSVTISNTPDNVSHEAKDALAKALSPNNSNISVSNAEQGNGTIEELTVDYVDNVTADKIPALLEGKNESDIINDSTTEVLPDNTSEGNSTTN